MHSPTSPTENDGIHIRHRKPSLSGRVPLERISALDRKEDFEVATAEINNEMLGQNSAGKEHQE